ncbi:MAG: rane protein [Rhizorhabdus sp.]|nr:rane protein [Rhizorhabdus sp.]
MTDNVSEAQAWPKLDPLRTGLRGACPRCGRGHLFTSFLKIAKQCDVCGLDYGFADPADGPAFFVICFGCIPCVTFALALQIAVDPPYWVHMVTTLPFMLLTCVLPLRPLKGWLTCSQYFYKAREGRLVGQWYPYGPDKPAVESLPHPW